MAVSGDVLFASERRTAPRGDDVQLEVIVPLYDEVFAHHVG